MVLTCCIVGGHKRRAVIRLHSSTPEPNQVAAADELIAERCQQWISLHLSTHEFAVSILFQIYIIHSFY